MVVYRVRKSLAELHIYRSSFIIGGGKITSYDIDIANKLCP